MAPKAIETPFSTLPATSGFRRRARTWCARINVDRLNTKLILQGANIPITAEAEAALHARGILSVPDFIANAGGVICAAVEYAGGTETAALATIEEKVRGNTAEVVTAARDSGVQPRETAIAMARARVDRAMTFRRDI